MCVCSATIKQVKQMRATTDLPLSLFLYACQQQQLRLSLRSAIILRSISKHIP